MEQRSRAKIDHTPSLAASSKNKEGKQDGPDFSKYSRKTLTEFQEQLSSQRYKLLERYNDAVKAHDKRCAASIAEDLQPLVDNLVRIRRHLKIHS